MQKRPLFVLAALAAATEPDFGRDALAQLKNGIRHTYANDPMGGTITTVLIASWLFYRAERGRNPKVKTFYDAVVYVTTNLSVGHSDVLAKTPGGKAIGSVLMTFGPAMAAKVLDEPGADTKRAAETQAIVTRLDRILEALEALAARASRRPVRTKGRRALQPPLCRNDNSRNQRNDR